MQKKYYLALVLILIVLNIACKKNEPKVNTSFSGQVTDYITHKPVPNYPISLSFFEKQNGMQWSIHKDYGTKTTNALGYYQFEIIAHDASSTKDMYLFFSNGTNDFSALSEDTFAIDVNNKQITKNFEVLNKTFFNLVITHTGPLNRNDYIVVTTFTGIPFLFGTYSYLDTIKNTQQETTLTRDALENSPIHITYFGLKNSTLFGPITDTVIFSVNQKTHHIQY